MKLIISIGLFLCSQQLIGQPYTDTLTSFLPQLLIQKTIIDTLLPPGAETVYKILEEDSLEVRFVLKTDTSKVCVYFKKTNCLKIFNSRQVLIIEGFGYHTHCSLFVKNGKWISYYPNGTIKTEGYYESHTLPVGLWKHYYSNSQLEKSYTLINTVKYEYPYDSQTCMAGLSEEYFMNGQLKISGIFNINLVTDSLALFPIYDDSGNIAYMKKVLTTFAHSSPVGKWVIYKPTGELLKEEQY